MEYSTNHNFVPYFCVSVRSDVVFRQFHYEIVQTQPQIRGDLTQLYQAYYEFIPINNTNLYVIRYQYYAANAGCDCTDEVGGLHSGMM